MKISRRVSSSLLMVALLSGVLIGCDKKKDPPPLSASGVTVENVESVKVNPAAVAAALPSRPAKPVTDEVKELVQIIRPEAERGDAESQYLMGTFYINGSGVPVDYVEAFKWLQLAAAQGDKDATTARTVLAKLLTSEQRAEAEKRVNGFTNSTGAARP